MAHMSPASPDIQEQFFWRRELNTLPSCSQFPGCDQLTALFLSLRPKHTIIDPWPKVFWYQVAYTYEALHTQTQCFEPVFSAWG